MAFVSQKNKKEMSPFVKKVLKKHGYKGTLKISHHMTLAANITEGPESLRSILGKEDLVDKTDDLVADKGFFTINTYHIDTMFAHNPKVRDFLLELKDALNGKGSKISNYNNSDAMTDYFDVGWYIDINFGNYWTGKPYKKVEVA
jgi:hypothetical protein